MKTKIVIGSLLAVCMLIMLPPVSAIEFNTVTETNKQQLLSEDEIRQGIAELKQQLNDHYIDIELLIIIISGILMMVLSGKISILMLTGIVGLTLVVIYEFITGDVVPKCSKMPYVLGLSLTGLIVVLEKLFIQNKYLASVVCLVTYIIGSMFAMILMIAMSS